MQITKLNILPDNYSANPTVILNVTFEGDRNSELIIGYIGRVKTNDGIRLADVLNSKDQNYQYQLREMGLQIESNQLEYNRTTFQKEFHFELTSKAIETIEIDRCTNTKKQVCFNFEFEITILKIDRNFNNNNVRQLKAEIAYLSHVCEIPQSKWIQEFAESLGIGKYLLIEFPVTSNIDDIGKNILWSKKMHLAQNHISEMQLQLQSGRWEKVIEESRKIWELFRIPKTQNKLLTEFGNIFIANNYSDEGIKSLLDSLWSMHDYTSKFIHVKDKSENLKEIVYAKKEDAYFVYMWVLGLVNMLNEKLKHDDFK